MRLTALLDSSMRRRWAVVGIVTILMVLSLSVGCSPKEIIGGGLEPPEQTVQSLLELRAEASTDASAYAEYAPEPAAKELAYQASQVETGTDLVPEWETPYLSYEDTTTASVVVIWVDPEEFDSLWPEATVFRLEKTDDRWIITDTEQIADKAFAPKPE